MISEPKQDTISLVVFTAVIAVCCFVGFLIFEITMSKDNEGIYKYEYEYDTSKYGYNTYTRLVDFKFHVGPRYFVTLTFDNGDKFLYACGRRTIDICNNLNVGVKACYYKSDNNHIPSEVVYGWKNEEEK